MTTSTDITEIEQPIPDERQGRARGWFWFRSGYSSKSVGFTVASPR